MTSDTIINEESGIFLEFIMHILHEVEQAEATEERRRLTDAGRLERRFERSRNPIVTMPSISFSDTFFVVLHLNNA